MSEGKLRFMHNKSVTFVKSGRGKAQCPPDPNYPNGIDLIALPEGDQACLVALPYPAPECGYHLVECGDCGLCVSVTAAGRPDDPRSVLISCKPMEPKL